MGLDGVNPAPSPNGQGEGTTFDPALWVVSEGFTSDATSLETSGLQADYLNGELL